MFLILFQISETKKMLLLMIFVWAVKLSGSAHCPKIPPCECRLLGFTEVKGLDIDCRRRNLTSIPDLFMLEGEPIYQIDLSENNLKILPNLSFADLYFMKLSSYPYPRIDLSYNPIRTIQAAAFAAIIAPELSLIFINSSMTEFPDVALSYVKNLTFLHLMDNSITEIPHGAFTSFTKLQAINLSGNKINNLNESTFQGLEGVLEVLYMNSMELGYFPSGSLKRLKHLRRLELDGNNIGDLPSEIFHGFHTRHPTFTLSLQFNDISYIPQNAFQKSNFSLKDLNLSSNNLSSIDFLDSPCGLAFRSDAHLDVIHNPIHCDCDTLATLHRVRYTVHGRCFSPWNYADLPFDTTNGVIPHRYGTLAAYDCEHLYVNHTLYVPMIHCGEATYFVASSASRKYISFTFFALDITLMFTISS